LASELGLTVAEKAISTMPSFILKHYYTKERVGREISIDTRSVNPIEFVLSMYMPEANAWFTVTNFTNLKWSVHDFLGTIWLGQPLAFVSCRDKPTITRKGKCEIYTTCFLNELQVSRLKEAKEKSIASGDIYVTAYFESKVGLIEFKRVLEHRQIRIQ
jgi:hypothetical protein